MTPNQVLEILNNPKCTNKECTTCSDCAAKLSDLILSAIAEARSAAVEECCKAVCEFCRGECDGLSADDLEMSGNYGMPVLHHKPKNSQYQLWPCKADAIRRLSAGG